MTRFMWCALCQLLLVLACSGCGDGASGGARVDGTVTLDGANLEEGGISFYPVSGEGRPTGGKITSGKYSIKGVATGKNRIHIDIPTGGKRPTQEERAHPQAAPPPPKIEGIDQEMDVAPGSQEKNIDLHKLGQ
jgi:hypothetical protein